MVRLEKKQWGLNFFLLATPLSGHYISQRGLETYYLKELNQRTLMSQALRDTSDKN